MSAATPMNTLLRNFLSLKVLLPLVVLGGVAVASAGLIAEKLLRASVEERIQRDLQAQVAALEASAAIDGEADGRPGVSPFRCRAIPPCGPSTWQPAPRPR